MASSDDSSDCSNLLPGWYYTGTFNGRLSNDNVLQCPEDKYCTGAATIDTGSTSAQGIANCPTGSGTVGAWTDPGGVDGAGSRDELNDCRKVYPGYYYDGDAACTGIDTASGATTCIFRKCDDPGANSFCLGANISGPAPAAFQADVGRSDCATYWTSSGRSEPTRTTCTVVPGFVDCSAPENCIS